MSDVEGSSRLTIFSLTEVASTIISSSCEISGAVVSITVISWLPVDMFPDESDAVQVTMVSPIGKNSGALFVIDITSPLSVAIDSPNWTSFWSLLVASTIISSGTVKVGDIVSIMVTLCSVLTVFFDSSVAIQVTMVSPIGKNSGALFVIETAPIISWASGDCNSIILFNGTTASAIMSESDDMIGGVVSTTLTYCVANTEFPELSTAVHITADEPKGNIPGELFTINWMPLSSVAVASPTSTEVKVPLASITKSSGKNNVGFTISITAGSSGTEISSLVSTSCSLDSVSESLDSVSEYANSSSFFACSAAKASCIFNTKEVWNFCILL